MQWPTKPVNCSQEPSNLVSSTLQRTSLLFTAIDPELLSTVSFNQDNNLAWDERIGWVCFHSLVPVSVRDYLVLFSYKMSLGFRRVKYKFCFHVFTLIAEMCLYLHTVCLSCCIFVFAAYKIKKDFWQEEFDLEIQANIFSGDFFFFFFQMHFSQESLCEE